MNNLGTAERLARFCVGSALIFAACGVLGPSRAVAWAWAGLYPLFTCFLGWCPFYALLGHKTGREG